MLSGAPHAGRAAPAEAWSPELVLVDRRLAVRVRELLAEPDDTLARLERELAFRRRAARAAMIDPAPDEATQPTRRLGARPRPKLLVAGGMTAAFMVALLLGVNVDLRGTPAGADSFTPDTPTTEATTTPAATPGTPAPAPPQPRATPRRPGSSGRPPTAQQKAPRRFAWAPVSGASSYRIEFFRGDVLIYSAATAHPQLALPPKWAFRGRTYRLSAGTYRWYVWPIVSGLRQAQATVQAELVVP